MRRFWTWLKGTTSGDVVHEHAAQVYQQLRRIFGPQADIDDVFQTVFVEVLRSLPGFRGAARLGTWIRRITWNVAYQEMRAQYQAQRLTMFDDAAVSQAVSRDAAEDAMATQQAVHRLYQALRCLDPRQRMVVVLHDIEGHTLAEVGEALGRPLQTVASQLHSGRAALVGALGQAGLSTARGRRGKGELP